MRAPAFWHRPKGLLATALSPLGALYGAATARRVTSGPRQKVGVPVICIGNINAGGTGKTPSVIELAQRLQARGMTPHAVSRGYGGRLSGPVQVSERDHTADQTGDEPLLLAAFLPTWIARDRAEGARAAAAAGADVILLDDGFQNGALHHDLSIIVVDARQGFGNGCVLPAGPLRESIAAGMARGDLVLSIGGEEDQDSFTRRWGAKLTLPRITGHLAPLATGIPFAGLPVLAFAGIGQPEKFFATLRSLGAQIVRAEALADHQPLGDALITRLTREAKLHGAQIVTTEKDAVRLPRHLRGGIMTLPVRLEIDDPAPLEAALDRVLS